MLGADDHQRKPVNSVLLNARINASLEKKQLRDQHRGFLIWLQNQDRKELLDLADLPADLN